MTKHFIHMSDLHFREEREEDQGILLKELISDLEKQILNYKAEDFYIIFTGDIVHSGGNKNQYNIFTNDFSKELDKLGIKKEQRICVPGNHDIDINKTKKETHKAITSARLTEKQFNDHIEDEDFFLDRKFDNYKIFQNEFAKYNISNIALTGSGHELSNDIAIYCMNSAITCRENSSLDEGNLLIDTRSLHKWNNHCKSKHKILVMHHPIEYLAEWAQKELNNILEKDFSLFIHGHTHEQSGHTHIPHSGKQTIKCSAPPLFTNKQDDLGYAIFTISNSNGVEKINYRQWTKYHKFVPGVNFTNNETGIIKLTNERTHLKQYNKDLLDNAKRIINQRFQQSLELFNEQPTIWVQPIIIKNNTTIERNTTTQPENIAIEEIISTENNFIISAEALFGGTSLAHYICNQQIEYENKLWVYIDSKQLTPDKVSKYIEKELVIFGVDKENVHGLIIDSWTRSNRLASKIIEAAHSLFPNVKIGIIESSKTANRFPKDNLIIKDTIIFENYSISTLTRERIREIVTQYYSRDSGNEQDTERALKKLINDLKVLNLHRTAYNCITLLKAEEVDFDESPVNRTEVIKRILFLLFSTEPLPNYKTKPDLKDCEHTLGWFCEILIRENNTNFSIDKFISEISKFCSKNFIKLDIETLFTILKNNNIIIEKEGSYTFKHLYWVMYFCALRMHHDKTFRDFIFQDLRYSSFPELIEFYTGIDRSRDDALEILINDLSDNYKKAHEKCGFPQEMNPYDSAQWTPEERHIERLLENFETDIQRSKLPTKIKDQFADSTYNPNKPYNQEIQSVVREYLMDMLMQLLQASSRALRNSDYAKSENKIILLKLIFDCWVLITKIMLVISPILASQGRARFEGSGFELNGDFGNSTEERFQNLLRSIPDNIVDWFIEDIYSHKMGPLLFNEIESCKNPLKLHYLILTIIDQKPEGWNNHVEAYITKTNKNSFYLYNVYENLSSQISYKFCSNSDERKCTHLLKKTLVKHETGKKNPGKRLLDKLKLDFK